VFVSVALAGFAGFVLAPHAEAVELPPVPTVTLPSVPPTPTLPVPTTDTTPPVPTGTSGDPTGTPPADAASSQTGTTTGSTTPRDGASHEQPAAAVPEGAVRLPSGRISIPVTSVRPPARLVLERLSLSTAVIRTRNQRLLASWIVSDSRGYVVRGATVDATSVPAAMIAGVRARRSATDGLVRLTLRLTQRLFATGTAWVSVIVAAHAPGQARRGGIAVQRVFALTVRPPR
jgi:hypothetical protein